MRLTGKAVSYLTLATSLALVHAECPNACSRHGVCGIKDMCTCDRNWQGSDCSRRKFFGKILFVFCNANDSTLCMCENIYWTNDFLSRNSIE